MSEHQLVGSSVFDRTGHLIGKVSRVEPLAAGDFSLAVAPSGHQGGGEIAITNRHLKSIDSQQKVIRADLDYGEIEPNLGQSIQLVEERIVVNRKRNKVGEISVRKVIETEIVEVPIRREKLVIERIGESAPLGEFDLSETKIVGNAVADLEPDRAGAEDAVVSGQFLTIREAVSLLSAIARLPNHGCRKFRIALFLRNLPGMETTLHEFESPDTAVRVLSGIETYLFQRCSSVYLDLFLSDPAMVQTYQGWFTEHATAPAQ
jgi:hypothetical protein